MIEFSLLAFVTGAGIAFFAYAAGYKMAAWVHRTYRRREPAPSKAEPSKPWPDRPRVPTPHPGESLPVKVAACRLRDPWPGQFPIVGEIYSAPARRPPCSRTPNFAIPPRGDRPTPKPATGDLVIVESPFASKHEHIRRPHARYLAAALRDCLGRGEVPFASHGLYTLPGVLRDEKPHERRMGMAAGWAWMARADRVVVYTDRGISSGMIHGIEMALALGVPVEYRTLPGWACSLAREIAEGNTN